MRATRSRRRGSTSTPTGTTLLCLPGDLLQRVLTFLERPDVENARRVCSGLAPHGRAALRSWQWLLHDENRRATLLALWAGSAPTGHSAVEALHARTHSLTTLMPARSKVEYPGDMMHYSLKHEVTVVRPCDQESMDCGYHAGAVAWAERPPRMAPNESTVYVQFKGERRDGRAMRIPHPGVNNVHDLSLFDAGAVTCVAAACNDGRIHTYAYDGRRGWSKVQQSPRFAGAVPLRLRSDVSWPNGAEYMVVSLSDGWIAAWGANKWKYDQANVGENREVQYSAAWQILEDLADFPRFVFDCGSSVRDSTWIGASGNRVVVFKAELLSQQNNDQLLAGEPRLVPGDGRVSAAAVHHGRRGCCVTGCVEGSLQIWDVRQPAAALHVSREVLRTQCYPRIRDLGAADHMILGTVGGSINVWDARRLAAPLGCHPSQGGFISAVDFSSMRHSHFSLTGRLLVGTKAGAVEDWQLPALPEEAKGPRPPRFSFHGSSGTPWWGADC